VIVVDTITRRWYAFAFLAVFLWAARAERSWKRALRFLAVASVVSFLAEYSSTHGSFPYGHYVYIAHTEGKELYISNVPLFVPLTFGIVVWAGRALAARRGTGPLWVVLGGALGAAAIDLVIDPVTLRGGRWFLGRLYDYHASGPWFSVPWSNFAGWVLVAGAILLVDTVFERGANKASERGFTLAMAICAFFVVTAFVIRRPDIGAAGLGVTVSLVWLSRYT
jgi:putative membrane protein